MILLVAVSVLVQILAVLHVYRTGREQMWIWVILLFNMLGVCAYFAFEIMPELFGPNSPRAAKARAQAVENPSLRFKQAEAALAEVETAASHTALADIMLEMKAFDAAATHYQAALDCLRGPDRLIEMKLAQALLEGGKAAEALAVVERQEASPSIGEEDRRKLLQARILDHMDRDDEALALYADITTRLPGAEARCRYAALLLKTGRRREAQSQLEQASKGFGKSTFALTDEETAMRDWARATLVELRSQPVSLTQGE